MQKHRTKTTRQRQGLALLIALLPVAAQAQTKVPQFGKDPVSAVVKAMTLDEKVRVVVGKGLNVPGVYKAEVDDTPDKVTGISGHTMAVPRLGIPSLALSDGPAGMNRVMTKQDTINKLFSTAWPTGTLLASSWDTDLVRRVGAAYSNEAKQYGVDFCLFPAMNLQRDPLGGRNFEYYSEDPFVTGKIAAAAIKGIQSNGVGSAAKHFAANNQETNRSSLNTVVSERALREIYLRGFEIAVREGQPWSVMSSYNLINGTYTAESYDLITTILRKDWGFKGFVMTDWLGGKDAVAMMKAGNDLLMPGKKDQVKTITEAVQSGKLPLAVLDENVTRILTQTQQTPSAKGYVWDSKPDLVKDAQISRNAATECMVLLKNSANTLPLKSASGTVAVFGNHAFDLIASGTGSGNVSKSYSVSLVEGLTNANFKLNNDVRQTYVDYLKDYRKKHPLKSVIREFISPTPLAPEYAWERSTIEQSAANSEVAFLYLSRTAGENNDRKESDFELSAVETDLINNVSETFHAKGKKVIVVINSGGSINVAAFRDKVDAILLAYTPGLEGGNAMVDLLTGKVNPSGKLACTFPVNYKDASTAKNFPGTAYPERAYDDTFGKKIPSEVTYEEGVYVGYRYFTTFNVKPAYEFGYGLSYTTFGYTPVKLSAASFKDKLAATVTVTNTGKVAGKEVVELYLSAPKGKLDKPVRELKGFAKTNLLQPGQSQTITLPLTAKELASFDTNSSSWVADAGKYTVSIGASSLDIKSTATFTLPGTLVAEKDHKALAPKVVIVELKSNNKLTSKN